MLDWEENVFLGLRALYLRAFVRPEERRRAAVRATLKERRGMLLLLAEMLTGREVLLFETDDPRLCGQGRIFLPAEISLANCRATNVALYEVKTIVAALALREEWHRNAIPLEELVAQCQTELPGLAERLARLAAGLPGDRNLWGLVGELPEPSVPAATTAASAPLAALAESAAPITTEIEGQGQAEVHVLPGKDDDGPGADLPMHTFEKVETLEEYNGLSRKSDDADELEEHAEALSSLKMTQVIRSPERPRSIYRADVILDGLALESAHDGPVAGIPYPEWDWQQGEYRRDWCHVQEGLLAGEDAGWTQRTEQRHRELIRRLKRQFATLTSDWLRLRRQNAGSEFDLDALIHSEVERRTGHTPDERIYQERRRDLHDVAVLVLLDASYSTDAWLDNRHVLQLITETVFCVGEVLEDYVARFALAAFSSNTRRSCRFDVVKPFHAPWGATRGNLGAIQPFGYTRIGPALRHAQELLCNQLAARKIVILVTDGRPCDYDRYEGRYGIQDVKKAIETGKLHGIQTHAFAIEKQAAQAFPQMFTRHHFDILARPEALAKTMCKRFARLLVD